jgi:heme-degrading monooxygenase HmoA
MISKTAAQLALAAVRSHFAQYLEHGEQGPRLVRNWEAPSGRIVDVVIAWDDEDAPYEWTLASVYGEGTVAQTLNGRPDAGWPVNVWAEPYTATVLSLSPNE